MRMFLHALSILVGCAAFGVNVAQGHFPTAVTLAFVIALQIYNLGQLREIRRLRASAEPPES